MKNLEDWSVVRPTCRGLSDNRLVGPLLLDSELHAQYMKFVKDFVGKVYSNKDLLEDIRRHNEAIFTIVNNSPDADTYGRMDGSSLLEWMNLRSNKVLQQLEDWDNGVFPDEAGISSTRTCVTTSEDFNHFPGKKSHDLGWIFSKKSYSPL